MKVQLRISKILLEEEDVSSIADAHVWAMLWKIKYNLRSSGDWIISYNIMAKSFEGIIDDLPKDRKPKKYKPNQRPVKLNASDKRRLSFFKII